MDDATSVFVLSGIVAAAATGVAAEATIAADRCKNSRLVERVLAAFTFPLAPSSIS
jgi:hypothetical protein